MSTKNGRQHWLEKRRTAANAAIDLIRNEGPFPDVAYAAVRLGLRGRESWLRSVLQETQEEDSRLNVLPIMFDPAKSHWDLMDKKHKLSAFDNADEAMQGISDGLDQKRVNNLAVVSGLRGGQGAAANIEQRLLSNPRLRCLTVEQLASAVEQGQLTVAANGGQLVG